MPGIADAPIDSLPVAIVDIETTGLHPRGDRILEIAVVRVDPGAEPRLVLDTLVDPKQPVSATEIHGITDDDVRGAPTFRDLAPAVVDSLSECVFAAYNVYFDSKFVAAELGREGVGAFPPHLCLMYMRPLLGLGARCSLDDACRTHGVPHRSDHVAADDALASARLWLTYMKEMEAQQLRTFGDLMGRKSYKFFSSFSDPVLDKPEGRRAFRAKSRWQGAKGRPPALAPSDDRRVRVSEYWEALKAAVADLAIERSEVQYLVEKRQSLALSDGEVRAVHARAFAGLLASVTDDQEIDTAEVERLAAMADALRQLGWAPGDHLEGRTAPSSLLRRLFGG